MASSWAKERGPGQGKRVIAFGGAKLVEQPDAVALAAAEDRLHLLAAEPVEPVRAADDVGDGVEAFEPLRMAGHGFVSQRASHLGAAEAFRTSLHDMTKFCHQRKRASRNCL